MRISSQGSVIMINSLTAGTMADIASATQAKPCALTLAAAGPALGDVIVPHGTGWASIEGRPFKISLVAGAVVTLEDSDTTRELNPIGVDATVEQPIWIEMCRTTFTLNSPAGAVIDTTTLCDLAHRIQSGLPAISTWAANGFYDVEDAALPVVRDHYRTGENAYFDVRMRDGSGLTFSGTVNTYDVSMAINAAVTTNLGGNVDGMVCFYETPPAGFVPLSAPAAMSGPAMMARPAPATMAATAAVATAAPVTASPSP